MLLYNSVLTLTHDKVLYKYLLVLEKDYYFILQSEFSLAPVVEESGSSFKDKILRDEVCVDLQNVSISRVIGKCVFSINK